MQSLIVSGLALATLAFSLHESKTCATSAATGEKSIVETAVAAGNFKTLAAALGAAGLTDTLGSKGPFTVFAPTDEAFAKLPKGTVESLLKPENREKLRTILTYHVVAGDVRAAEVAKMSAAKALNDQRLAIGFEEGVVRVAGATVIKTDIGCSNGVIHVVDSVMMPATKNLVATAADAGSFKTLAAALQAAGLVEALSGDGPFTVFAPTDEAFAKLPKGTLEELLKPENREKLAGILKYHVVSGRVYADQLETGETSTLAGKPLAVKVEKGSVRIGAASVSKADLETTNGVIHVIDTVLLPR